MITTIDGRVEETPGYDVDEIDVESGAREAAAIGYDDANMQMLTGYCLSRWAKGEEHLAQQTAIHCGIDLTSWYRILAASMAGGRRVTDQTSVESTRVAIESSVTSVRQAIELMRSRS